MTGKSRAVAVPASRVNRLTRLGTMTAGVAGNMAIGGLAQLGRGQRPKMRDLLLAPRNITRIADQLAQMRGAAMKVGQLMSMDSGEMLPPELAQIMARLRAEADFMPPAQLKKVLATEWPEGWLKSFARFDARPIAAASIGQVHRAHLRDGRDVAIKVQYPGIARSIDSDISNVGTLIRMSGLVPKGLDIEPYLEEARRQLHEETDYLREGRYLTRFDQLLADDDRFAVPKLHSDWSTANILSMSFLEGSPIEDAQSLRQAERDHLIQTLLELVLKELFEFGVMQTDPNFANYRFDGERIHLLDFGAAREIDPVIADQYRQLISAGLRKDRDAQRNIAFQIGFMDATTSKIHEDQILQMMSLAFDEITASPVFDFAATTLPNQMQVLGTKLAESGFVPPQIPVDVLYLQRKFAGMFLLAARLRAKVDVVALMDRHIVD